MLFSSKPFFSHLEQFPQLRDGLHRLPVPRLYPKALGIVRGFWAQRLYYTRLLGCVEPQGLGLGAGFRGNFFLRTRFGGFASNNWKR